MLVLMPNQSKRPCTHCGFVADLEDLQHESKWSEEAKRFYTTYRCWRCRKRSVAHAQRRAAAH